LGEASFLEKPVFLEKNTVLSIRMASAAVETTRLEDQTNYSNYNHD
jgi:hypothetical protein